MLSKILLCAASVCSPDCPEGNNLAERLIFHPPKSIENTAMDKNESSRTCATSTVELSGVAPLRSLISYDKEHLQ